MMLTKAGLLCVANGRKRSLYSLRHTYAIFQILYSKIDLHLLSKNMGTSIAILERYYSYLEVLHRADIFTGRAKSTGARVRRSCDAKETAIIQLDEASVRKTQVAAQAGRTVSLRNY